MNAIFRFLGRDVGSIHHAAYTLAVSALFTQILGLIRDRLLAGTFGAGELLDIYYAAFKVQDFIFYAIGSLLSLAVLIPLVSNRLENEGIEKTRRFLDGLFSFSFLLIAIFASIAFIFAPQLAAFIFPGLMGGVYENELIFLMRFLLLSPFFFSFSGILASIVQLHNRFYITALSPLLYNFGIIIGIVLFYPLFGLKGLGAGVILGAFLHMGVQLPFVIKKGLLPHPTLSILWSDMKEVLNLSFFRGVGISIQQIMLIFILGFSTTLASGSVSVMTFAQNLQGIPLSLIGASYSVATFPVLSRFFSEGDKGAFILQLQSAARHIIFWSVPFAALFIVLRAQIVRVILGSGAFSWSDTRLVAACLALFAVSVVFQGLSLLLIRAYYASGLNKEGLVVSLISAVTTVVFSYAGVSLFEQSQLARDFFENLLRVEGIKGSSVIMLALAFSIGSFVNTFSLALYLRRKFSFAFNIGETAFHSFAASVSMGFVSYQFLDYFGTIFNLKTTLGIFLQGFFAGVLGILFGAFLLLIMKNKEALEVISAIKRRIKGEEIIGPQEI